MADKHIFKKINLNQDLDELYNMVNVDDKVSLTSVNPLENQVVAHELRELNYQVMIAQEGVRQVAKRVKALEDANPPDVPEHYDLLIESAEDLLAFAEDVSNGNNYLGKRVVLARNIDLEGVDFRGIGKYGSPFKGMFDGQNHCILNMKIYIDDNDPQLSNRGFFNALGHNDNLTSDNTVGVGVKNLHIIDGEVRLTAKDNLGTRIGGLVGYLWGYDWILENCTFSGTVGGINNFGGLIGQMFGMNGLSNTNNEHVSKMTNCSFTGFVEAKPNNSIIPSTGKPNNANRVVGGLVGKTVNESGEHCYPIIENCKFNGMIRMQDDNITSATIAAGIVASLADNVKVVIHDCYSNALMLVNDETYNKTPIVGAVKPNDEMTNEMLTKLQTNISNNTWNVDLYPNDEYGFYDFNGEEYKMK